MGAQSRILVLSQTAETLEAVATALEPLPVEIQTEQVRSEADVRAAVGQDGWRAVLCVDGFGSGQLRKIRAESGRHDDFPVVRLVDPSNLTEAAASPADGWIPLRDADDLRRSVNRLLVQSAAKQTWHEAALEALFSDVTGQKVLIIDADERVRYANAPAAAVLKLPVDKAVGRHLRDVFRPDAVPADLFASALHTARDMGRFETWLPSGGMRLIVARVNLPGGLASGFVLALDQGPQEMPHGESLLRAQKMEAIEALTRGIAHDFNNLLTAIFGYTELAKNTLPAKHEARQTLGLVEQAAQQAQGVAKSLLAFTRQSSAAKEPLDLTLVLDEALKLARHALPANITISTDVIADGKVWVAANAHQIQQIAMNLAMNARDAMPQGGRLFVSLGQEGGGRQGRAALCIRDEGPGMEAEVQRRAAEPFFTTKPRDDHSGLGLSVTQGIVTDHGGTMKIESQPGRGTAVTVHLPLCTAPSRPAPTAMPRGAGELVLIVESDDQVRSIMVSALRSAGYDTVTARTCQAAQEQLQHHKGRIELLIVDVDLPEADRRACIESVVAQKGSLPAIMAMDGVENEPTLGSECDILHKPFRMTDLVACVNRKLAARRNFKES